jgi:predicted nucleotidyltransferase component of viral defense system
MLEQILKNLTEEKKRAGYPIPVIQNLLKEILQWFILDFISNSAYGKDLIFTGGSALRVGYNLNRLSEDLDFDLEKGREINKEELTRDILAYFEKNLRFGITEASISGQGKKIYLKFPILYELGLAKKGQSDKLYVKLEIEKNLSSYYQIEYLPLSRFNLNFLLKVYTLETLMAAKIIAILKRTYRKGKSQITFKGRDYYDLLWFLQKGVKPLAARIKDVLRIQTSEELINALKEKISNINPAYLKEDLLPLFEDFRFMENYCLRYTEIVKGYLEKTNLF